MGAVSLPISELSKIPFVQSDQIRSRTLSSTTFFDGNEWHSWIPTDTGLFRVQSTPVEANYFGTRPEHPSDVCFQILNFVAKRAFFPPLGIPFYALNSDFHNLAASLAKIDLFHSVSAERKSTIARFVVTEFEYIVLLCRSVFDLLQDIIIKLWDTVTLHDQSAKKRKLPKSFSKVLLSDDRLRTPGEIKAQFSVHEALAQYYHSCGPFFVMLRDYRDAVAHLGKDLRILFVTERGFAVQASLEPFASFGIWTATHLQTNGLASLRPIIAYLILQTIAACENFAHVMEHTIQFPPDIVPGFDLYTRGHHTGQLFELDRIVRGCLWWDE